MSIELGVSTSSDALARSAQSLDERDLALCYEITLGVLRKQLFLDHAIDQAAKGRKLDLEVRIALRLGLYQLWFLDRVPDYPAISESVDLAGRARKGSAKPFVNAILRRLTRKAVEYGNLNETARFCIETSHPPWVIERWSAQFGPDTAKAIASANNVAPNTAFRSTALARSRGIDVTDLLDRGAAVPSGIVNGCFVAARITPALRRLESEGLIYFQDEASQYVGSLAVVENARRVLDMCASPGSKTGQIAANMVSRSNPAMVVAGDINKNRAELLKGNVARQGASDISIVLYDGTRELPFAEKIFDVVLLDAPCSGSGTIRHNPEIRYRLSPHDIIHHSQRQRKLLKTASKLIKPGGTLIYSTCSLEREENEEVVSDFLQIAVDFRKDDTRILSGLATAEGFARTLPSRDDMDGFFAAVLIRG